MPKTHLRQWFPGGAGLLADLPQLIMANDYWKTGEYRRKAVFQLFFRQAPVGGPYIIAAGLELVSDFLQLLRFDVQDIQYLGGLAGAGGQPLFDESFLNYLQRMHFRCDVDAMPEGAVAFPHQPLLRIEGPIVQGRIVESALLNLISFSTLIATQSARIVQEAKGDPVLEAGLWCARGIDGGLTAARSAYIGGCHGTGNLLAGRLYGIPARGTMANSRVICFDEELPALEGVYQLSALENDKGGWDNSIKLSDTQAKSSIPGILQVQRFWDAQNRPMADVIYERQDGPPQGRFWEFQEQALQPIPPGQAESLLQPVFREGKLVYTHPPLSAIRAYSLEQQARFGQARLANYPNGLSEKLFQRKAGLVKALGSET